ncbi:MAG: crossover junction endodeoxyribonuclease RuvC [Deltaproteobacteria bacterium]|nr:MAG: crossover junction endodeoxyribonuclease RuvC [Deltaproteobacteria bacterium]
MLVLGVDPGSNVTGYGLVEKKNHQLTCVHFGLIKPPAKAPFYQRIYHIFRGIEDIMAHYGPGEMAIEDIFYAKNVKSSLKLGHARGAILVAAAHRGIGVFEYSPLEIKKSVVGYGRAAKEQVRTMVRVILKLKEEPALDASDALAVAVCHLNWSRFATLTANPRHEGSRK